MAQQSTEGRVVVTVKPGQTVVIRVSEDERAGAPPKRPRLPSRRENLAAFRDMIYGPREGDR
jgi:hypothetical protein